MTAEANKEPPAAPAVGAQVHLPVGRLVDSATDLCMLTAAAEAISLQFEWHHGCGDALHLTAPDATAIYWNPLASNADALALMVALEMDVFVRAGRWTEAVRPMGPPCKEPHHGDPLAATRRAIVRAAAEVAPHQPLPDRRKTPNVRAKPALPEQEQR